MKNRTLPYGYCCKNGVIVIEPQESKVLKRIYAAYLDGSSMLTIAEQLNREKIEYRDGVTGWNKGRLKQLIDNTKYLGTEVYPPIIDQDTTADANAKSAGFVRTRPAVCESRYPTPSC